MKQRVRVIALRAAGFNSVDAVAAEELGLTAVRVPACAPHAAAEHAAALILALNRKVHRAFYRVREQSFSLDGLMALNLHHRMAGIVSTREIGAFVARIMADFRCQLLAHNPIENQKFPALGARCLEMRELTGECEIITMHCPPTAQAHHLIDEAPGDIVGPRVTKIITSRGALVNSRAAIAVRKSGHLGHLCIDEHGEESELLFRALAGTVIQDDVFAWPLTFPSVVITAHRGLFSCEALPTIADTALRNVTVFDHRAAREENHVDSSCVLSHHG